MKNEKVNKPLNFTITFIILGCVIVHGDYRRWQMSVNRGPNVECCVCNGLSVVCVMGRSDTGPAEYRDSRDRCSDECSPPQTSAPATEM